MCFLKKNIFDSLTRQEVVETICLLEREEEEVEQSVHDMSDKIKQMLDDGKNTNDMLSRTLIVKKITMLNEKRERAIRQAMYILYNIRLSERLKDAIDDNSLVNRIQSMHTIDVFKDQRALALYLNNALQTKIREEDVLTEADDTFMAIEQLYENNLQIYGITNMTEDKLLAFFEENSANQPQKNDEETI